MIRIADVLDRDLSVPIEEVVHIGKDDPSTALIELREYVATDRIRAEYERLFSALAAAKSTESFGVWISGFFGAGKSSFAKNLAHILGDGEVLGASATSLLLKQLNSRQISESVEFLNRTVPCEVFALVADRDLPPQAGAEQIAETMYRIVLRDLGYTDIPVTALTVEESIRRLLHSFEVGRPGKTLVFILDEIGQYLAFGSERIKNLHVVLQHLAESGVEHTKACKIPRPPWIIATAEEKPHETLTDSFKHRIDLSAAGIAEVAARRVLHKRESQEFVLLDLFKEHSASVIRNVALEGCSRRTGFDEDQFVQFYPYLPHLIDLSIDIVAGIRLHPNAPKHIPAGSRTIIKQCSDLLVSARLADEGVGALVSIDRIYEVLEVSIPPEKQHDVQVISEHCDRSDHPGMAARVAKAICLMEFARKDLPRTTSNIAALLVQDIAGAAPTLAVAAILDRMRDAYLVHETAEGWKLHEYDFDELHRETGALDAFKRAVGTVNPRPRGWRNNLIQVAKRSLARTLAWYTRHLDRFHSYVARSLEDIVSALAPLVDLPIDMVVLQRRVAQSEKAIAILQSQLELLSGQVRTLRQGADSQIPVDNPTGRDFLSYVPKRLSCDRTAYVLGLFGTGRLYVSELIHQNIGERAKYFRHAIRLHLGPTPMIYTGHATIRQVSRGQNPPAVTSRILEAVREGFADLIFIYRHPLDSLLTNWVWWRANIRDHSCIDGISQIYQKSEDFCTDLDRNFSEFKWFAEGDPRFFANAEPGPRFLSFPEFVQETGLYLESTATLNLRLEDFAVNPLKEFSKIAEVMSVDIDLSGSKLAPPKSKPYGYIAARDNVPRFREFIEGLDTQTKRRIEKIGYTLSV